MPKTKNVLVCPLDWGLGHATRLVPVVDSLIKSGANVFIGADNRPMAYLKKRFPACSFLQLGGFSITYPENGSMAIAMIRSFPQMVSSAKKSNRLLQKIIKEKKIDIVISDNRYELSTDLAYTVFITHQLNIQTPGVTILAKPIIQRKIYNYIRKFDELWIPDFDKEPSLSGKLSHVSKMPSDNVHFIGPLSRFTLVNQKTADVLPELLVLLSGPEPQRTILEHTLTEQALKLGLKTTILQGKPEKTDVFEKNNVKTISHLPDEELAGLISVAKNIVCRPGYSSIMDLAVFGKNAVFIPTPGQTEQEYLAKRFMEKGVCYSSRQINFNLASALEKTMHFKGFQHFEASKNLNDRIFDILNK